MGHASQFQPGGFYPGVSAPEPIYAYPTQSIYGTLPRGPPRPVKPMPSFEDQVLSHRQGASQDSSAIHNEILNARGLINYATFRQNISAEAAEAAKRRAEVTAQIARHWSNEDLRLDLSKPEDDASESSSSSSTSSSTSLSQEQQRPPSPPPRRNGGSRSRSTSPGKTVTFSDNQGPEDHQDERSLNELESSPRRMKWKPLALAASTMLQMQKKRKAPSPPPSLTTTDEIIDDPDDVDEVLEATSKPAHEVLGAKLSANLRAKFGLQSH